MENAFFRNFSEKQIWKLKKFSSLGFVVKLILSVLTVLFLLSKVYRLEKLSSVHVAFFALIAISIVLLSIWSIKSWLFSPREQWRNFVDQYYSSLFDFIQEENTEITSIWPIKKTDVRIINHSKIIHCTYEEFSSRNLIKGSFGNNSFELSEIEILHLFKTKFRGFFFFVEFDHEIESTFNIISEQIAELFEKHKEIDFNEVRMNSCQNILFLAFPTNRKLFGCKDKKTIRKIQFDVEYFNNMFAFLRETTGLFV